MKVTLNKPLFDRLWSNLIQIENIKIDNLEDKNDRKEMKIYGKENRIEYEILIWFKHNYFTGENGKVKNMRSKKGLSCTLRYLEDENFNMNINVKSYIPKIIDIKGKNKDKIYIINESRSNKLLGVKAKLKISNKDLLKIHPGMQFPGNESQDRIHYSHNTFYSGGGCSPR